MPSQRQKEPLEGKSLYLLILTAIVQFIYPISVDASPYIRVGYQGLYLILFIVGIQLVTTNQRQRAITSTLTALWLILGIFLSFQPQVIWGVLSIYSLAALIQILFIIALLQYIFRAPKVTFDVLNAACIIYLLLGGAFAPVYGIIETVTWFPDQVTHAFVDSVHIYEDRIIPWQAFVYYSFSTLTTLGYGELTPLSYWGRSVATLEAVVGVLYITIVVARLVGLYATDTDNFPPATPATDQSNNN